MQQQAKTRLYDVVRPGNVLADNMLFALGHLAFKASAAAATFATDQSLQGQMRAGHQAGQRMITSPDMFLRSSVNTHLQNDAGAFIQAWNDTLDAAVHENAGKQLSISQVASMLMNLRYRAVFMKAMNLPDHKRLLAHNGYLALDQAHRDAMAAALGTMSMYDLE